MTNSESKGRFFLENELIRIDSHNESIRIANWNALASCLQKKTEWSGAGVVICLERGADFHMDQLMPLPLTVSCFSKIQIGFTFLVLAYRVVPEKGP